MYLKQYFYFLIMKYLQNKSWFFDEKNLSSKQLFEITVEAGVFKPKTPPNPQF